MGLTGYWSAASDRTLSRVFAGLPPEADDKQVRRAVRDAYPFGERRFWPYKVWLRRAKLWRIARAMGLSTPEPIEWSIRRHRR